MDIAVKHMLVEMFKRVGAEYSDDFVRKPDWFLEYTWSAEEEASFKKWLVTYLRSSNLHYSKRHAELEAGMILLNIGWKTQEPTC